ncbi:unnamed protein product [Darwinula stevensoni]|uniref:TATA-binding protein interacting (TIP20) domain-containing protein n=1 Tax=Darwinula stevensoni TaxID=69355 RepID=A0A7R9A6S0_9CRUS|nr:unnamed protein product [Darwinula stevensoni]CAG0890156.1 unnamed protein product [Darwinula stevensoni]
MGTGTWHIANLLEKMTSSDKDFRFMATNDLMSELQKDSIKLDDDSERKVVKMLLRLLEDKNGEVQNLAVKCLGPLVNKVKELQVETIVDSLCSNMVSDKEQLRDISSIGLKTVICELPPSSVTIANSVCKRITKKLVSAINQGDVSVQLEALDILGDLLSRFGGLLISFHADILSALLPLLASPRLAVRKRSIICIGHLVISCNAAIYNKLLDHLFEELGKSQASSTTRTHIQCLGAVCRHSGHRFGEYLERAMPLVMKYCSTGQDDDELREYCIQAFESFIRRCPKEIADHIENIVNICKVALCYDPNYNYEDEEVEDGENGGESMDIPDGEESEEEYSDDDDMSWKVRRAAAKCLEALTSTRPDMLSYFYKSISALLISRFKEREENVKSDIFAAYMAMLKQTRHHGGSPMLEEGMEDSEAPIARLSQQIPQVVKALHKTLKEKSVRTRQGAYALLSELVSVLPGALTNHIHVLVPGIQFSLGDKTSSSNMKIDTLSFLHILMSTHPPQVFHAHIPALLGPLVSAVKDPFYKITSEALMVIQQLVRIIRPLDEEGRMEFVSYIQPLYSCTLLRLKAADIDQEVKERAISCMGVIIANLGDHLNNELFICLPIFLDRLRNEITRLTTVKALTGIAASPLKIDLKLILGDTMPILGSFLRKNQRALRLSTLTLLDTLVKNYNSSISPELLQKVLDEVPPLINDSDLHMTQLTFMLLTTITKKFPGVLATVGKAIMLQVMNLLLSPLLQGAALAALQHFLQALVAANLPGMTYHDLLTALGSCIGKSQSASHLHKQAYHSIAKCVAALATSKPNETLNVVKKLLQDVQKPQSDPMQLFSLLAIGEIGKNTDLSAVTSLNSVIMESFGSPSEEVKTAASYALGNVAVGNLCHYLPFVLNEIQTQPRKQYLLLHSLKEIISTQSASPGAVEHLQPYVSSIWDLLFENCECSEEGTRNVVAECLGKLTLIDPHLLLPKLKEHLSSESPLMRSTVVTAIKFTISDQPQAVDTLLRRCIGDFLATLEDPDIGVRRVALITFNSAAHNKPSLIRDLLDSVLPLLYKETVVRKEFIREVEMGPFKHTVDDGLDLRKAAFECMYTLLDSCLDRVDVFEFLNHVESGLKDHYDIKMLTYLMLVRLSHLCPMAVLQRLDRLVEPLRSTCTRQVKANSVKQESEKLDELKRSAMRCVAALQSIPDADKNLQLNEFLNTIRSCADLQVLYESTQRDSANMAPSGSEIAMDLG